jgi:hypothetical protein
MPVGKYRVIAVGNQVGIGATGSYYVTINAFAKQNGPLAPYCIPNEMICAEIGRFLGLPLSPWGIVQAGAAPAENWFATLDFNLTASALPPIDPVACCATFPDHSTGVLLFDTLTANSDRHTANLSADMLANPPSMNVFDHSHSLFGFVAGQGSRRLIDLKDRLGMSGGPHTHGNRHCLLDAISTDSHFGKWFDRIGAIPDFLIEDCCNSAAEFGNTQRETKAAIGFLKRRRDNLRSIVEAHRGEFHSIQQWSLFP